MTRIDRSESQLDAEADARELGLRWLIIDLRRALMMETPDRLHTSHTSSLSGEEHDRKGWPLAPDEGGLGPPFSSAMHRFLRSHVGPHTRNWDRGPDPRSRPAMASIQNVSEWCHAVHTSHRRPGFSRSLCAQMLFEVGYLGQEPSDIAWLHQLEPALMERMLLGALRKGRTWREDVTMRLSRQPGTAEPIPERRPFRAA